MDIKDKQRGARLEALRSAKGISQIELAKKLGYKSDSTISKWEAGMSIPTGGKLVEIAKLLETTTDYILFGNSNIVLGDNNGVNGLNGGSGNTNTYNFGGGCSEKQDNHNESMHGMSKADLKLQRVIANKIEKQIQVEQNMSDKMDKIADKLDTLIGLLKSR
jgi:DNA-binding XRE family transcriptional regulator